MFDALIVMQFNSCASALVTGECCLCSRCQSALLRQTDQQQTAATEMTAITVGKIGQCLGVPLDMHLKKLDLACVGC